MRYTHHTLQNGLRVVFAQMQGSETATVLVMTGTGSRYESISENGLAHFLEHMFFKGTEKRPTAREISEELDAVGSAYNAFTSKDKTAYYAKVSSEYIDTALDVVSDIVLNSTLPGREITKERGAIIQEIDMYEDMPMRTVDNVFDELMFGADHPLGRTILGPKENIRSFKRSEFHAYHRRNYTARNTVVCIAGSFPEDRVLRKIRREFGALRDAEGPSFVPFTGVQDAARLAVKHKQTDQTHFMIGVGAYPYQHPDEYALAVLSTILGGGMSSRLFMEVREKRGLAYSVQSWVEKYPDTGAFVVQAGVEHGKLGKTVDTILKEFKRIKREPVVAAELKKAKAYLTGTMTLAHETSDEVATSAASSMLSMGFVRSLDERRAAVMQVTAADITRVAQDLLRTERLNLAVIGPHKADEIDIRALTC